MRIIKPSYSIESDINGEAILRHLEKAIRVCYKSEEKIGDGSHLKIIKLILDKNHESTLEHQAITVRFVCNRGFTHEMVRHRISSFSQESTRYCNYSKGKHGSEITVIEPPNFENWYNSQQVVWNQAMVNAEESYLKLIRLSCKPQEARGVLPIDVKTEIVVTSNLRQWRTILIQRTSNAAHPSMRQLMIPLLREFQSKIPLIFDDIEPSEYKA